MHEIKIFNYLDILSFMFAIMTSSTIEVMCNAIVLRCGNVNSNT